MCYNITLTSQYAGAGRNDRAIERQIRFVQDSQKKRKAQNKQQLISDHLFLRSTQVSIKATLLQLEAQGVNLAAVGKLQAELQALETQT